MNTKPKAIIIKYATIPENIYTWFNHFDSICFTVTNRYALASDTYLDTAPRKAEVGNKATLYHFQYEVTRGNASNSRENTSILSSMFFALATSCNLDGYYCALSKPEDCESHRYLVESWFNELITWAQTNHPYNLKELYESLGETTTEGLMDIVLKCYPDGYRYDSNGIPDEHRVSYALVHMFVRNMLLLEQTTYARNRLNKDMAIVGNYYNTKDMQNTVSMNMASFRNSPKSPEQHQNCLSMVAVLFWLFFNYKLEQHNIIL